MTQPTEATNPDDLDDPPKTAPRGWAQLPGWFDFEDIYRDIVRGAPKDAVLVEVGVCMGRSLAFLARQAIDLGRKDLALYGVDLWGEWSSSEEPFASLVRRHGSHYEAFIVGMETHAPEELARVLLLRTPSTVAARMIRAPWFVFIDADHGYEAVKADLAAWAPRVAAGGILAGHDYTSQFPGVVQAVHEAFGEHGVERRGNSWWRRMP